ncbi:CHAT domain-containing protein, partial [Gordonia amicalis]|uniref:CHAT domain-containing protein n=1 Tax=Gordonia amicalis TaxID=89053 RepID=UPI003A7FD99E
ITTADGVELAGFPLALMLRGAVTVIGGLYNINDASTTAIMSHFWAHYATGTPALIALHGAKRHWLHTHPHADHRLWAGLIAYGAATD